MVSFATSWATIASVAAKGDPLKRNIFEDVWNRAVKRREEVVVRE